jgi:spermidine synthase
MESQVMAMVNTVVLEPPTGERQKASTVTLLFLASALALYFELVVIRYLSSQIRVFAYLQNLPLIASFLGIGLGMALGRAPGKMKKLFPGTAGVIFIVTTFAERLHLTHVPFPSADNMAWGNWQYVVGWWALLDVFLFYILVLACLALIVAFFVVLGGFVGEQLSQHAPLRGYGVNLIGSLAGILLFTLLSFLGSSPAVWLLAGFALALPFFWRSRTTLLVFGGILCVVGWPTSNVYWSPYYRITIDRDISAAAVGRPERYWLSVNYDYHQKILDLSAEAVARTGSEPHYQEALAYYDLAYRLASGSLQDIAIVGAGTGNDVAAALRNGAGHVDAVEIDPTILNLGKQLHPEHPYDSGRVTIHQDDARAFFHKTRKRYDLIVFGLLDSHTLMSARSSLRLDNYVYTLESLQSAKGLLKPGGLLVLSFDSGRDSYVTRRMFATLERAFGTPPHAFYTGFDGGGVTFVEGNLSDSAASRQFEDITGQLEKDSAEALIATDYWPFLYLQNRRIPLASFWSLILFLYCSEILLNRTLKIKSLLNPKSLHFFLLGAAFLLLETKSVTELSLVFGSTWIVNAVVIAGFLAMALLANTVVMFRQFSYLTAYIGLFACLAISIVFPYHMVAGFGPLSKVLVAGTVAALPVFFSGLIFSKSFSTASNSHQALGVNLFGAVAGGMLENTVTLGGVPLLGILAVILYGLSAALSRKA